VRLSVELGRTDMKLKDVLALGEDSVVMLDRLTDELLDVMVNGKLIARGEIVAEGNRFGLRIVELAGGRAPRREGALMLWYILKLLILLPLIAGLAWGCSSWRRRCRRGWAACRAPASRCGSSRRPCSRPRSSWP
jgi:flagellar motor switch protein FliN/FliY